MGGRGGDGKGSCGRGYLHGESKINNKDVTCIMYMDSVLKNCDG